MMAEQGETSPESILAAPRSKSDRIEELWREGNTQVKVLAELVGASERHVQRVALKRGLREKVVPPTVEAKARARVLLAEGMLATWVAEDTGLHYDTVLNIRHSIPGFQQMTREWKTVWQYIRRHSRIRELHDEIAGPPRSYNAVKVAA